LIDDDACFKSHIFYMSSAFDDPSVKSAVEDLAKAEEFFASAVGDEEIADENNPFVSTKAEEKLQDERKFSSSRRKEIISRGPSQIEERLQWESTLDEPVLDTIKRDLSQVGRKILMVIMPYQSQISTLHQLRDWDLWGPLFIGLFLAILLAIDNPRQGGTLFAMVFVVIWAGAAVITINAALLGANLSFWQSVCVLGYSVFPLCVARSTCLFFELFFSFTGFIRLCIVVPALFWSTKVSVLFISEVIPNDRRALAVYPVFGFYAFLGWLILVV